MKLWEFEVFRAAAMVFVVLSRVLMHLGVDQELLRAIADTLGDIGNSLFFFASGYLLYTSNGYIKSAPVFYMKRIIRIYPLYILAISALFITSKDFPVYALGLQGFLNLPVQGFWFVGAILIYYIVYPVLSRGKSSAYMIMTALAIMLLLIMLHLYYNLVFADAIYFFLTFAGGVLSAYKSGSLGALYENMKRYLIPSAGIMLAFIFSVIALRYQRLPQPFPNSFAEGLAFSAISIAGCITAYCIARAYGHLVSDKIRPQIAGIAFSSYATYLLIGFNLAFMDIVLDKLKLSGINNPYLVMAVIMAAFAFIFISGYLLQSIELRVIKRAGSIIVRKREDLI